MNEGDWKPASFKSSRRSHKNHDSGHTKQVRQTPSDFMDESDGLLGAHLFTHNSYQAFAGRVEGPPVKS